MVKECRIDAGLRKKDPPKTHGTRVDCETGAGLGGQRVMQEGHRARRALCKFLHPACAAHIYHNNVIYVLQDVGICAVLV